MWYGAGAGADGNGKGKGTFLPLMFGLRSRYAPILFFGANNLEFS